MKGYLIDPAEMTITEVETTGKIDDMYRLLNVDVVDLVHFTESDDVWVDDEGLLKHGQQFFMLDTYPQPLAGRGLVLGKTDDGNCASASITLSDLEQMTHFVVPLRIGNRIAWTEVTNGAAHE